MRAASGSDVPCHASVADALKALQAAPPTGCLILVKGSRGVKLEKVLVVL